MKLKIDQRYKTRNGRTVQVKGITKENPAWAWTVQGDWYEMATGKYVTYSYARAEHLVTTYPHHLDIIAEYGAEEVQS